MADLAWPYLCHDEGMGNQNLPLQASKEGALWRYTEVLPSMADCLEWSLGIEHVCWWGGFCCCFESKGQVCALLKIKRLKSLPVGKADAFSLFENCFQRYNAILTRDAPALPTLVRTSQLYEVG